MAGPDAHQDLAAFWMPFTDNRGFKAHPRLLASAKDMHYFTPAGRKILDGTSGMWCVNAGHSRAPIIAAIQHSAATLDFAPTFQLGHPLAFQFANRLADMPQEPLDRIFFTNSGSEAVDTALKIALAYHKAVGQNQRVRLIGRERGYHGVCFGGISVGGIANNRGTFEPLLPGVDHMRATYDPKVAFLHGQPPQDDTFAGDLERIVAEHGVKTIAAVIVEPVAGSAGVLVAPKGYLEKVRAITQKHGILLIFDEVITGAGRLGALTGAQALGVTPDIITMVKGITNSAVPMGAVAADRRICDAVMSAAPPGIELFHGHTYSGHPLAAAGLATLQVYEDEGLFSRAASLAPSWEEAVHSLRDAPHVIDVRNLGLMAGIELESRGDARGARAREVFQMCFDEGLLVRVTGDIVALSPPLIVSNHQVDEIVSRLKDALEYVD